MNLLKRIIKVLVIVLAVILIGLLGVLGYLRFALPKVSPPDQTLKIELTPLRIERGEYLANNVMDCFGCHGQKMMDGYTYPLIEKTRGAGGFHIPREWNFFPGDVTAPNITPFALSEWTDGEILRALVSGISRDGRVLFPMMPYPDYGKLDREDMYSIIAYLRTLPSIPVTQKKSEIDFPLSLILRTLPKDPEFRPRPDPSDEVATGKYLVDAGGCMICHTVVDKRENPIGEPFAGGREFNFPPIRGIIRSANITPDTLTGIGGWSRATFIQLIRERGARAQAMTRLDPEEPNTLMPYGNLARMTDEDLGAIHAYLRSLPAVSKSVVKWELKPL